MPQKPLRPSPSPQLFRAKGIRHEKNALQKSHTPTRSASESSKHLLAPRPRGVGDHHNPDTRLHCPHKTLDIGKTTTLLTNTTAGDWLLLCAAPEGPSGKRCLSPLSPRSLDLRSEIRAIIRFPNSPTPTANCQNRPLDAQLCPPLTRTTTRKSRESMQSMKSMEQET